MNTQLFPKDEKLLFFPACVCLSSHSPPARDAGLPGVGPGLPGQMGVVLFFLEKQKTADETCPVYDYEAGREASTQRGTGQRLNTTVCDSYQVLSSQVRTHPAGVYSFP